MGDKKMSNYMQLNNILDSESIITIAAIFFIILIFAMGFFLGRHFRIKGLENNFNNKFNQELQKIKEALNQYLEEEGKDIRIAKLEGVTVATDEKSKVKIIKIKED